eukprot:9494102-Pyramimonas_sp.AAC.1
MPLVCLARRGVSFVSSWWGNVLFIHRPSRAESTHAGQIVPKLPQSDCWECPECGCQRNEAWWSWCKHCGATQATPAFG